MEWLSQVLTGLFTYFYVLFAAISAALRIDPRAFEFVEQYPQSAWIVLGIVFLAGASMLLGQSAILFINRVSKGRFFFSLGINGLIYIVSYAMWGFIVYFVGRILFQSDPALGPFLRMVGLSTAPLVFGFFVLIPWMGPFVSKVLNVWSFLILLALVRFEFQIGFWGALICVGLGWLASLALNNTIGKPIVALRNRVWKRVTGSSLDASAQQILMDYSEIANPAAAVAASEGAAK